ncbi:unnamed protein product [Notodromas monacha]|uniref:Ankyrin repeat domain-containing protein n=1 Tax=Notodromas monacha TaxID=399045 RepID=A0A7R9GFZ7_9CRUS|nr:unnamed protein product [Notodromas monacha]CAG0921182.1 unnamed protein product [Notodromas monacha]
MAMSAGELWPLHMAVWENNYHSVHSLLTSSTDSLESKDPRGRTPLLLSVIRGNLETTKVLLDFNANVNVESPDGWTAVQEATALGDADLLLLLLKKREEQRNVSRVVGIPALLRKLQDAPDFYVEMKWEFTSWVPLASRMCPSDTYKIYKRGADVRIDTTLLGFDQTSWRSGNRSYVFKGQEDGTVMLMEIDHDAKKVYTEPVADVILNPSLDDVAAESLEPSWQTVQKRLKSPIVTTYINIDKISFERNKSGILGWRSDKQEEIDNYSCKVFSAQNVELVTKTRTEHLSHADKRRASADDANMVSSPLQTLLGFVHGASNDDSKLGGDDGESLLQSTHFLKFCECIQMVFLERAVGPVTAEEYFDAEVDLGNRLIGTKKREILEKLQRFRATLWLCEDYPLRLPEQILPIVDLMAISSAHFAKLREFIQLQLPSGFPVRIEIPLFHILNARITFGNIFAMDSPVAGVSYVDEGERKSCYVDESVFEAPVAYQRRGSAEDLIPAYHPYMHHRQVSLDEDDELLQFAIQQSLMEAGTEDEVVDVWEALNISNPDDSPARAPPPRPGLYPSEDVLMQRAIAESLSMSTGIPVDADVIVPEDTESDVDLAQALELSRRLMLEEEELRKREDEELQKILNMSLLER